MVEIAIKIDFFNAIFFSFFKGKNTEGKSTSTFNPFLSNFLLFMFCSPISFPWKIKFLLEKVCEGCVGG